MPYFPSFPCFSKHLIALWMALLYRGGHGGAPLRSPAGGLATGSRADRQPQGPPLWIHRGPHTEVTLPQGCSQSVTKLIGALVVAIPVQCRIPLIGSFCLETSHQPDSGFLRAVLQRGSSSPVLPSLLLTQVSDLQQGLNTLHAYTCPLPLYPSQAFPPIIFLHI